MNFFDDLPARLLCRAKQPVNQFNRTVVWVGPAAIEKARIVKNYDAAWFYERAPVVPVALHATFRVVAVNHQQIDGCAPVLGYVLAEFFQPYRLAARAAFYDLVRGPLGEVQTTRAAQMIWVDQIERAVRRHHLAQRQGGNAFGDTDFNERLAALGPALERSVFGGGVLSDKRTQT